MTEQPPLWLSAVSELDGLGDASRIADTILGLLPQTGVMVLDADLRIVLMRGGVHERHGYDAGSSIGRHLYDVIPAVAWDHVGEYWRATLAGESPTLETSSVDGKNDYWVHFAPLRTDAGVVGAIMVAQDVTEREQRGRLGDMLTAAALRRSEERFRQGFDNAPIAMTLVDPANLRYVRVNDAFCTLVGRTRAALAEMTFADLSHADGLAAQRADVGLLLSGELDHYVTESATCDRTARRCGRP